MRSLSSCAYHSWCGGLLPTSRYSPSKKASPRHFHTNRGHHVSSAFDDGTGIRDRREKILTSLEIGRIERAWRDLDNDAVTALVFEPVSSICQSPSPVAPFCTFSRLAQAVSWNTVCSRVFLGWHQYVSAAVKAGDDQFNICETVVIVDASLK